MLLADRDSSGARRGGFGSFGGNGGNQGGGFGGGFNGFGAENDRSSGFNESDDFGGNRTAGTNKVFDSNCGFGGSFNRGNISEFCASLLQNNDRV